MVHSDGPWSEHYMDEHTRSDIKQEMCSRRTIMHGFLACVLLTTLVGVTQVSAGNLSLGKEGKSSSTKLLQPLKLPGLATKEKNTTKNLLKIAPKAGFKNATTLPKAKSPFSTK
jgi:hypothetical protein